MIIAAVVVPSALRLMISPLLHGRLPFVAYLPFVLLTTILLGWRSAVAVATGLAITTGVLANWGNAAPRSDAEIAVALVLFVFASSFIIVIGQTLRTTMIDLEAAAKREQVLSAELAHRGKNYLALIDAFARQSHREGRSANEFFAALLPRLQALARAQDLLTRNNWTACKLHWLANEALTPFAHHAGLQTGGPECLIPPESCMPVVMALHELATNASKYGALSVPDGRVSLTWETRSDGACALAWTERNGPRVAPPTRRGLGSRLLTREPSFADVELTFPPEGVRCTIVL